MLAAEFDALGFRIGPAASGALQDAAALQLGGNAEDGKDDFGEVGGGIEERLSQLPTRNEVWRAAMLGMLGGAVAAVTLIEAFARACN